MPTTDGPGDRVTLSLNISAGSVGLTLGGETGHFWSEDFGRHYLYPCPKRRCPKA